MILNDFYSESPHNKVKSSKKEEVPRDEKDYENECTESSEADESRDDLDDVIDPFAPIELH